MLRLCGGAAIAVLASFAWLAFVPTASADISFCSLGEGAGQCKEPTGLDVDRSSGDLYVADRGNNRIDVFAADGSFKRAFGWDVIPPGGAGDTGTGLETCTAVSTCKAGSSGSGLGQFKLGSPGPDAVAVDNDPASPAFHDVYVYDGGNRRVERFHPNGEIVLAFGKAGFGPEEFDRSDNPIALGPGGVVYVSGQNGASSEGRARVQEFEPTGVFIKQILLSRDKCDEGGSGLTPFIGLVKSLAVDAGANLYVATAPFTGQGPGGVRKYDAAGNLLLNPCAPLVPFENLNAIALSPGENLFIANNTEAETAIYQYNSAGAPLHTLYGNGTLKGRPLSLAPYSDSTGDIFMIEGSNPRRLVHIAIEPPGPVVLPFESKASAIGNVRATLNAKVNPEGKASTFHFQYVDDESFDTEGGFASPNTVTTPESGSIGADFKAHSVSFTIACPDPDKELPEGKCLDASTEYHFRAVAANPDAPGGREGEAASFETLPPIQLGPAWSTEVGIGAARLHAELNPTGLAAEARFEYVDDAAYQEDLGKGGDGFANATQSGEFDFGKGNEALSRSALIQPLTAKTTYHFRYVAHNFFGDFTGPERTFVTGHPNPEAKSCPANQEFRGGASANLPDCRAYELVSPIDKANGDIVALKENTGGALGPARGRIDQAAPGGGALAYGSQRAFGDALAAPYGSQYIATRHPLGSPGEGWSSHSLNPPREGLSRLEEGIVTSHLFGALSEDLCSAWFLQDTDVALVEGAPQGVPNLYRRRNCGEEGYELLTTPPPPGFGPEAKGESELTGITNTYSPTIQGFSADGSASAFKAPAMLTPEARTVAVGTELSCLNGSETVTYKWLRNGAPIAGKTAATYKTAAADEGKAIQCQVFSIGGGTGATKIANPAVVVAPFPVSAPPIGPAAIAIPSTSAPLKVGGAGGQTLTCEAGSWSGAVSFAYQWYRNGAAIGGATAQSYLVTVGNLASAASFQCAVTGEGAEGAKVSEVSGNLLSDPAPDAPNPNPRVLDLFRVYLHEGGGLQLVSVLPNGRAALTNASVGTAQGNARNRIFDSVDHAVAEDGSRVFWSAEVSEPATPVHQLGSGTGPSRLYLRLNAGAGETAARDGEGNCVPDPALACTIQISAGAAVFRDADPEASKALYSEGEDLYEVDVGKAIVHDPGARTLIAHKAKGILGASRDLSRVYLASGEVCSGASQNSEGDVAAAGKLNLYLYEAGEECGAGELTFVATLQGGGEENGDELTFDTRPVNRSGRVSGDGLHAAFMSRAALTDYDNTDAESGKADSEVYLYDASEEALRCVSCDPSGARPEGGNISEIGQHVWTAAQIPGWETEFQPSRPLSEDGGRLFFESFEGLVSRDTNEAQDVYEWERAGSEKECLEGIGGELFSPKSGGCLSLISSGKGGGEAEFLDASASGSDVFFTTASSLVAQDPGLVDIYDAREGGGFPSPPVPSPPCEGEACQSPPAPPSDPTPASSSFSSEQGNIPTTRTRAQSHKKHKRHHKQQKHHRRRQGRAAR